MLFCALVFFFLATITGAVVFTGIVVKSTLVAEILFYVFLTLFAIMLFVWKWNNRD